MTSGFLGRLRPRFLVRDRAVLTGYSQRVPQRLGFPVIDPVSGAPFELTVFRYPGRPQAPQLLAVHGFRRDHHALELIVNGPPDSDDWLPDSPGLGPSAGVPDGEHTLDPYAKIIHQVAQHLTPPPPIAHTL